MSDNGKGEATTEMSTHPWYQLRAENERLKLELETALRRNGGGEQYETIRAEVDAKNAECEATMAVAEERREHAKAAERERDQLRVECDQLRGDRRRFQQELSEIETVLFHPYPQRTLVQAIQDLRAECERRANDWAAAMRALDERDAELTELRTQIPTCAVHLSEDGKYWEVIADELHVGNYTSYDFAMAVQHAVHRVRANWWRPSSGDGQNAVSAAPDVQSVATSDSSLDKMQKELYGLRHGTWVNRFVQAVADVQAARKDALEAALRECNDPNIRRGETVNGFSRHYTQRIEKLIREVEAGKSGAEG